MNISEGVQSVIQAILDRDGEVTASVLVETARPENSPAHGAFEWNDATAGHNYRLHQARRYLRVVQVSLSSAGVEEQGVRLVHIPSDNEAQREGAYKPITVVVQSPDEFRRALGEARRMMNATKRAVDDLVEMTKTTGQEDKMMLIAQLARGMDIMHEALGKM